VGANKLGVFTPSHPVPGLIGKTLTEVRTALQRRGPTLIEALASEFPGA